MTYSQLDSFEISQFEKGTTNCFYYKIASDGLGQPVSIPVVVIRGLKEGKTLGITALVHGNELNGLSVIQQFVSQIDVNKLSGNIIAVPVVNNPSFHRNQRRFVDGEDLNRTFPGQIDGNRSEQYVHNFIEGICTKLDYLIDLHTASYGRVNSYYIRANMESSIEKELALLQNADIVLHVPPADGTLRGAASELGIHAITVEVGDPNKFQKGVIKSSIGGLFNVLSYLEMIPSKIELDNVPPVICSESKWLYSDEGGILEVTSELTDHVNKGEVIARLRDIFGKITKEFHCPNDGIVIGKSNFPVGSSGSRIIHLGNIVQKE